MKAALFSERNAVLQDKERYTLFPEVKFNPESKRSTGVLHLPGVRLKVARLFNGVMLTYLPTGSGHYWETFLTEL